MTPDNPSDNDSLPPPYSLPEVAVVVIVTNSHESCETGGLIRLLEAPSEYAVVLLHLVASNYSSSARNFASRAALSSISRHHVFPRWLTFVGDRAWLLGRARREDCGCIGREGISAQGGGGGTSGYPLLTSWYSILWDDVPVRRRCCDRAGDMSSIAITP